MQMTDDPDGGPGLERAYSGRRAALQVEQVSVAIAELDGPRLLRDVVAHLGGLADELARGGGVALAGGHHVARHAREAGGAEERDRAGDEDRDDDPPAARLQALAEDDVRREADPAPERERDHDHQRHGRAVAPEQTAEAPQTAVGGLVMSSLAAAVMAADVVPARVVASGVVPADVVIAGVDVTRVSDDPGDRDEPVHQQGHEGQVEDEVVPLEHVPAPPSTLNRLPAQASANRELHETRWTVRIRGRGTGRK